MLQAIGDHDGSMQRGAQVVGSPFGWTSFPFEWASRSHRRSQKFGTYDYGTQIYYVFFLQICIIFIFIIKVILGHHFVPGTLKPATSVRQFCDYCSGIIWSVVQASYVCTGNFNIFLNFNIVYNYYMFNTIDCNYRVHNKCIQSVGRVCAHVITSESNEPLLDISPEIGLAMQQYKCAECATSLRFSKSNNFNESLSYSILPLYIARNFI